MRYLCISLRENADNPESPDVEACIRPEPKPGCAVAVDADRLIRYDKEVIAEFEAGCDSWLVDRAILGSKITEARQKIADASLCELVNEFGLLAYDIKDIPPVLVSAPCPACDERKKLTMKDCMHKGGDMCCPAVMCMNCGYKGPLGSDMADGISRWNAGQVHSWNLLCVQIVRAGYDLDSMPELARSLVEVPQVGPGRSLTMLANLTREDRRLREIVMDYLERVSRNANDSFILIS